MKSSEIAGKYVKRGLTDYRLRTTDDLKEIHGVDVTGIKGYNKLTVNADFFRKMLVRFYNAYGLERRSEIKPSAVKYIPRTKTRKPYIRFEVEIGDRMEYFHFNGNGTWY